MLHEVQLLVAGSGPEIVPADRPGLTLLGAAAVAAILSGYAWATLRKNLSNLFMRLRNVGYSDVLQSLEGVLTRVP
jgi:hypothetical protein